MAETPFSRWILPILEEQNFDIKSFCKLVGISRWGFYQYLDDKYSMKPTKEVVHRMITVLGLWKDPDIQIKTAPYCSTRNIILKHDWGTIDLSKIKSKKEVIKEKPIKKRKLKKIMEESMEENKHIWLSLSSGKEVEESEISEDELKKYIKNLFNFDQADLNSL